MGIWYGYLQLNRLDEARATAREAQAHNIDVPRSTSTSIGSTFFER